MRLRLLRFAVMLLGAVLGYVVLTIANDLDDQPLWKLRTTITGETSRKGTGYNPDGAWVIRGLVVTVCTFGATLAATSLETIRHFRRPAAV